MMGHLVDTYHDVQMKGIDFLRNIYATAGLSIRPKTQLSKLELLKEVARAWGLNPEQILIRETSSIPHASYSDQSIARDQAQIITEALKQAVKKELLQAV